MSGPKVVTIDVMPIAIMGANAGIAIALGLMNRQRVDLLVKLDHDPAFMSAVCEMAVKLMAGDAHSDPDAETMRAGFEQLLDRVELLDAKPKGEA